MEPKCLVEQQENRKLDSYDVTEILELFKQHNLNEIWRRYRPPAAEFHTLNFHLETESYFVEMTVQILTALHLSAKYNSTPHIMQALVRRALCNHRHSLIVKKLTQYGLPASEAEPINLTVSVGNVGVDLIVTRYEDAPEYRFKRFGTSRVEQDEQRPLDHYDMVSILYFASMDLTDHILARYVPQEILNEGSEEEKVVRIKSLAGDYQVGLFFQRIRNDVPRELPPRGNVSERTMYQVLARLFAGHAPALVTRELIGKGIAVTEEEVTRDFSLARYLNDNYLELHFQRRS